MIRFAFYKGKGNFMNALIRWWTNGPYSHTEVIVEQRGNASLCYSSHKPDGGIRGKWRYLDPEEWDFVDIDYDAELCKKWYEDRKGAKYDMLGLLGLVFRRDDYSRIKYFCSEANASSVGISEGWRYDPNALKPIIDRLAIQRKENG